MNGVEQGTEGEGEGKGRTGGGTGTPRFLYESCAAAERHNFGGFHQYY